MSEARGKTGLSAIRDRLARLDRSCVIALTIAIAIAVAALTVAASLWKMRGPADQLEATVARLAALEYELQEKICAHRSNSVAVYRSAGILFQCMEIDVVVEPPGGGETAVYHPPAENDQGLTLDFLLTTERLPRGKLWLDVKDLAGGNWEAFLGQLTRLVVQERRGDVIVETSWSDAAVRDAAAAFRESGFLFSYYLPTEEAIQCGADTTSACDILRAAVSATASLGFSHLSFDRRAYPFVQTIRGGLPPAMRLLTWDTSKSWPKMDLIQDVDLYIVRIPRSLSRL